MLDYNKHQCGVYFSISIATSSYTFKCSLNKFKWAIHICNLFPNSIEIKIYIFIIFSKYYIINYIWHIYLFSYFLFKIHMRLTITFHNFDYIFTNLLTIFDMKSLNLNLAICPLYLIYTIYLLLFVFLICFLVLYRSVTIFMFYNV